jgi:hypothetical protein
MSKVSPDTMQPTPPLTVVLALVGLASDHMVAVEQDAPLPAVPVVAT